MKRSAILDLPLHDVMRSEIALSLQYVLKVYTVGNLLAAWRNPDNHPGIEDLFDSAEQARHAVATCAAWFGVRTPALPECVVAWWLHDEQTVMAV